MSIYATLWEIKLPRRHWADDEWVRVYAQAVPSHIGHPSHYPDGDPYADFLPPVVDYDPEQEAFDRPEQYRAVVILVEGRDRKDIQRYVDPLLVLTGKEYASLSFHELYNRICDLLGWDEYYCTEFWTKDGMKKIIVNRSEFPGMNGIEIMRELRRHGHGPSAPGKPGGQIKG